MLNELRRIYENKIDAELYTNREEADHFVYGKILALNDEYVAIKRVSPDGTDDGIVVEKTNQIFRIETETQYTEKMAKLQSLTSQESERYDLDNHNIREALLSEAQRMKKVVSIETLDNGNFDIAGLVEWVQAGLCKIRQINDYGEHDGVSYVRSIDITAISCDSEYEKIILSLLKFDEEGK